MNLTNHESGFSSAIKLDEKFRKISIRSESTTITHAEPPDDGSLDSDSDLVPTVYFVQDFHEGSFCYSDGLHSVHREFREVETQDNESDEHFVEDRFCYSDGLHSVHEFGDVRAQDSDSGGHFVEDSFCGSDGLCSSPLDEIESQSSDSVVDVLKPEEVRWFYKSESDKRWLEFSGYDSLRIEFKYRQLFRAWHNASNICTEHVTENYSEEHSSVRSALNVENNAEKDISNSRTANSAIYTPDSDHNIIVRGGMYEVDLQTWKCKSIYWKSEECGITRGIWFYGHTWQPLEEEYNELIEAEHLGLYCGQKVGDLLLDPASRTTNRQAVHTQSYPEFHVDWYSPSEVYLYSEAASSKLVRSFTQKLGFQKSTGYKLYRGFKYPATELDRPSDISHLVFVIHGIGQKMDTGRIIRNTSAFRDCISWLKEKYFATSSCRAEFFPVEWRSSLKLDGDIVESITPNKLWSLRQTLNSSAMDIMYYTSPLYGNEVQRGLAAELNRLYSMFSQHNPYFENNGGKVSVIAHSLGCVIVYDIVTGWKVSRTENECNSEFPSNDSGLIFQIENLFCLGSPLSVFLALRYRVPEENVLPASLCKRLFNVFHPSDPVAYRMEPLLVREYSRIAPVQIHAYSSASLLPPYTDLPLEPLVPDAVPILPPNRTGSLPSADGECPESPGGTPNKDKGWSLWGLMRNWRQDGVGSPHLDASPWGTLPYRLDYVLPITHAAVSYLYALTSHTAYWNNYDVAYFVLIHLFPQLEKELRNQSSPSEET